MRYTGYYRNNPYTIYILGWGKSNFGFFHFFQSEKPKLLFPQPNTIENFTNPVWRKPPYRHSKLCIISVYINKPTHTKFFPILVAVDAIYDGYFSKKVWQKSRYVFMRFANKVCKNYNIIDVPEVLNVHVNENNGTIYFF